MKWVKFRIRTLEPNLSLSRVRWGCSTRVAGSPHLPATNNFSSYCPPRLSETVLVIQSQRTLTTIIDIESKSAERNTFQTLLYNLHIKIAFHKQQDKTFYPTSSGSTLPGPISTFLLLEKDLYYHKICITKNMPFLFSHNITLLSSHNIVLHP